MSYGHIDILGECVISGGNISVLSDDLTQGGKVLVLILFEGKLGVELGDSFEMLINLDDV